MPVFGQKTKTFQFSGFFPKSGAIQRRAGIFLNPGGAREGSGLSVHRKISLAGLEQSNALQGGLHSIKVKPDSQKSSG